MYNIKFLKEPGYIYDLLHIFIFHFNKGRLNKYINFDKSAENMEFLNRLQFEFTDIPEELFVFFYLKEEGRCFLPQYCFYDNVEKYQANFQFENMQDDLMDTERIVSRMIQFYFPNLSEEEVPKYRGSLKMLAQLIDESRYSDYVKEKLVVFFINYEWIIKKLNFELISKESQLSFYYERNYRQIADFQNGLDFSELAFKVFENSGQEYRYNEDNTVYISPCIINKNCIENCFLNDSAIAIFGIDAESSLKSLQTQKRLVDLDVFGTAVSEKNRVGIIDALLVRDEMTIREIERMFDISNTNAYYHLNLMLKANIINARNQGRTMLYSLNRSYFDDLIEALKKYGTKKGREEG